MNTLFLLSAAATEIPKKSPEFIILYMASVLIGYLSGGLLFAYFIPKIIKHVDITEQSEDKNPGAFNAFKYGGFWCGIFALTLEIFKGFAPVYAATKFVPPTSVLFIPVILAPVLGHAFSPFFKLKKGGKCIAVSFGVLLGSPAHLVCAVILAGFLIFFSVIIIINPNSLRTAAAYVCCDATLLIAAILFAASFAVFVAFTAISAIVISKLSAELLAIFKKQAESNVKFIFSKRG